MRNLQDMFGQMKKMQEEILQKMDALRVEGSAGGGIVTVQVNGSKKVLRVSIAPEAVKESDIEMLQDLVQAAMNDAMRKVDDALKDMVGGFAGGMKLPGLF
jgi:DNA-binding YbaB/EbfC family protein